MAILCNSRWIVETRKERGWTINSSLQNKEWGGVREDVDYMTQQLGMWPSYSKYPPNLPGSSYRWCGSTYWYNFRSRNAKGEWGGAVRSQFRKGPRRMQPQLWMIFTIQSLGINPTSVLGQVSAHTLLFCFYLLLTLPPTNAPSSLVYS